LILFLLFFFLAGLKKKKQNPTQLWQPVSYQESKNLLCSSITRGIFFHRRTKRRERERETNKKPDQVQPPFMYYMTL
jgi:hypothetical protein